MLAAWNYLLLIWLFQPGLSSQHPTAEQTVVTDVSRLGKLAGIVERARDGTRYIAYRAVRYAEPPIGHLRFSNPVPVSKWSTDLNADLGADPPLCLQFNALRSQATIEGQEDCLFLNVYTPVAGQKLPVLVYIHGGGFFFGSGGSRIIGPSYFMDQNVVLVTLNYRLGIFGFLSTGDEAASGNWGLKDQYAALSWVRANIGQLGGDPDNVTIMGQSAGAASVHYHMLNKKTEGMIKRAVSLSGTALSLWAQPFDNPKLIASIQGAVMGCAKDGDSARLVECLRAADAHALVNTTSVFRFWNIDPVNVYLPVLEGTGVPGAYLLEHPYDTLAKGYFHRIPWLVSSVKNEGTIRTSGLIANRSLLTELVMKFDDILPKLLMLDLSAPTEETRQRIFSKIRALYFDSRDSHAFKQGLTNVFSDRGFLYPAYQSIRLHESRGHDDIYLFSMEYAPNNTFCRVFPSNGVRNFGPCHCDDLTLLFNSPAFFDEQVDSSHPDYQASKNLLALIVSFAAQGTPYIEGRKAPSVISGRDPRSLDNQSKFTFLNITRTDENCRICPRNQEFRLSLAEDSSNCALDEEVIYCDKATTLAVQEGFYPERMSFWASLDIVENMKYRKAMRIL